jgi:hypothetical protein
MKTKTKKKFRVTCAGKYCTLRNDFDPLGTVHPTTDRNGAHVFDTSMMANNCIARTYEQRRKVAGSLYPTHKLFAPLYFDGALELEEFEPAKP